MLNESSINRHLCLREMNIGLNTAEVLRDLLVSNSRIGHLDLCKNMLGEKGIKILAPAFLKSKSLVSLHLGSNEITVHGVCILLKALTKNESINTIDISTEDGIQRNRMFSASDLSAVEALKDFIVENRFCHHLKLRGVSLGIQGFDRIL
jgi:Ran GTPase-activating protein (RanGAP) involved in mRNA processing and transport